MEAALRKFAHLVKEEKRAESNGDEEAEIDIKFGDGRKDREIDNLKSSSPPNNDLSHDKQGDQIESAKAQIVEVREENQKLRMYLEQIMKDYQTLQTQFHNIGQQEAKKFPNTATSTLQETKLEQRPADQFVSLSLGRTSSADHPNKDEQLFKIHASKDNRDYYEHDKEGLALGLDCKFEMPKEGLITQSSPNPPSDPHEISLDDNNNNNNKILKTTRSGDDEFIQQNPVKKARVSVRVRCDTPTMNDGCQWRKYGQKIAKGNPCPRAYYRCTVAPSCPVRKQVQRCADDMSILITTYEGTHNHPLSISATAMASTTSAAASMLLSGSSTSTQGGPTATMATDLHGLNFYLSNNTKPNQIYLPNSSYSPSPSHPTITLDLTSTPSSSSPSHFMKTSPNFPPVPRYSSSNLNFSSLESNPLPISWGNNVLNYGSTQQQQPYNNNNLSGSINFGRQTHENFYQPYMQKSTTNPNSNPNLPPNHIEAATKAITSDPSFQSALAAALTSLIGGGGGGDKFGQNLKLGESFPVVNNLSSTSNANNCSSSYLINKSPTTTDSQPGSLMFMQPSLPFSLSKSKSTSPGDH